MHADPHIQTEFEVEASLLINEGGVQCVPVVFARLLRNCYQLNRHSMYHL